MKIRARCATQAVVCALLLVPQTTLAQHSWVAERVTGDVQRVADERAHALEDGARLADRSALRLHQHAALTLWRDNARLRTRGPGELSLHGVVAGDPRAARIQLREGALRVEAPESSDLRINAGGLRVRLSGGEAWMAMDPDGARVCALRGPVEVQVSGSSQTLTVRKTGACLHLAPDGRLHEERPLLETLNARLARADGGVSPLPVTFQTPPLPTYRADQPPTLPSPQADAPSGRAAGGGEATFYIILGAFSEESRAERARSQVDHPQARVLKRPDESLFRLAVGPFMNRVHAEQARSGLLERHPDAWLLVFADHR